MSASFCINCGDMVGGYEKYCARCVDTYGVRQDVTFHKRVGYLDEAGYKSEFRKDLAIAKNMRQSIKNHKMVFVPRAVEIPAVYIANCGKSNKQSTQAGYMKRFGSRAR